MFDRPSHVFRVVEFVIGKVINMDSTDQMVMGSPAFKKHDTLVDMPRFGRRSVQGSEGFPVWLKELFKKIKFDTGEVGVRIVTGEVRRGDIRTGDEALEHICMCISDMRNEVVTEDTT